MLAKYELVGPELHGNAEFLSLSVDPMMRASPETESHPAQRPGIV